MIVDLLHVAAVGMFIREVPLLQQHAVVALHPTGATIHTHHQAQTQAPTGVRPTQLLLVAPLLQVDQLVVVVVAQAPVQEVADAQVEAADKRKNRDCLFLTHLI
jgi:hypothetical protein